MIMAHISIRRAWWPGVHKHGLWSHRNSGFNSGLAGDDVWLSRNSQDSIFLLEKVMVLLELNMMYVKGLALSRYDRYIVNQHHHFKGHVLNLRSVFSLNSCTLMGVWVMVLNASIHSSLFADMTLACTVSWFYRKWMCECLWGGKQRERGSGLVPEGRCDGWSLFRAPEVVVWGPCHLCTLDSPLLRHVHISQDPIMEQLGGGQENRLLGRHHKQLLTHSLYIPERRDENICFQKRRRRRAGRRGRRGRMRLRSDPGVPLSFLWCIFSLWFLLVAVQSFSSVS